MKILNVDSTSLSGLAYRTQEDDEAVIGKIAADALGVLTQPDRINYVVQGRVDSDCHLCSLLHVMDFMSNGNPTAMNARLSKADDVIMHAIHAAENAETFKHPIQESKTTERVMRALKKRFPALDSKASHTVVTGKALAILFPPMIPDSPITGRSSLANRIYLLPMQFLEGCVRLIIDSVISIGLTLYGFIQPDEAAYQKMRLNMTKNHAWASMRHNVYTNLV